MLYGSDRLADIRALGVLFPSDQTRISLVVLSGIYTVLFLSTKRPRGDGPIKLLSAKVVALGSHDALGHNFG